MQFTTELVAHAICQLGRPEHQAGQRFPWQQERHWKEHFKKIVTTVSLLLLRRPQLSHCPYNLIDASWWITTHRHDLLAVALLWAHPLSDRSCFLSCRVSSYPPHKLKTGGGAHLVTDNLTLQQVVLGYKVAVAVAEQSRAALTWPDLLLYHLLLFKHKLSSLFSIHIFLKYQVWKNYYFDAL